MTTALQKLAKRLADEEYNKLPHSNGHAAFISGALHPTIHEAIMLETRVNVLCEIENDRQFSIIDRARVGDMADEAQDQLVELMKKEGVE